MTGPALLEVPAQQVAALPRQVRLDALRAAAQRLDPVRLHYLDLLAQRAATAIESVRHVLEDKLDAGMAALEARLSALPLDPAGTRATVDAAPGPLTELNQYLRQATRPTTELWSPTPWAHTPPGDPLPAQELASVRRFREAWQRITAEDQLREAVEHAPANAGPLNSHRLVLRSLALLGEVSPDYLQRFLSHVETLQWLEQASQSITPVKAKPARRSRVKK